MGGRRRTYTVYDVRTSSNASFKTVPRVRTRLIAVDRRRRRATAVDGRYASILARTRVLRPQ